MEPMEVEQDVLESSKDISMDVDRVSADDSVVQSPSNGSLNDSLNGSTESNKVKKIKLSKHDRDILRLEKEKLKEEREKLKLEKEKAKLEREKARIEKEKNKLATEQKLKVEREKKMQEAIEKKQKIEQEKQEKLRLKEEERLKKEKERKEKDEEKNRIRESKEKEKQKRIEEKLAVQEEERKKKDEMKAKSEEQLEKSRAVLINFLKSKPSQPDDDSTPRHPLAFSLSANRLIKPNIVPECILKSFDADAFMNAISEQNKDIENLYLTQLLTGKNKPYTHKPDKDVEIVEEIPEQFRRIKYILMRFAENVKPPYYGPRPINSKEVNGRKPFFKDSNLDYEVDSDEEWDEGGPGESLDGSDSENEDKDDYEIDNDFMVPHGYLSDDEGDVVAPDENEGDNKKTGPLLKEQALMAERSRRFAQKLKPQIIGCIWENNKEEFSTQYEFLQQFSRVLLPK